MSNGLLRSADPIITYAGQNVTADWLPAITHLTWKKSVGNSTNKNADSITISLADPTGYFRYNYNLAVKQLLQLQVESWNWNYPGEHLLSDATQMTISRVEIEQNKSRGTTVILTATSIPPASHFRLTKKSRSATQTDLKTVAGQIAKDQGWTLQYDPKAPNPPIKYAEQHDQSDATFLQRFCVDHDLYFRVRNKTLIIGSMQALESQAPVGTIVCPTDSNPGGINGRGIISWKLVQDVEDTYAASLISSKSLATGKTSTGYAQDEDQKDGAPVHNVPKHPISGPVVNPVPGSVTEAQ